MKHTIWGEIMDLHPIGIKESTHEIVEGKRETPRQELRETYALVGAGIGEYLLGRWRADGEFLRGWQIALLAKLREVGVLDGGP